VDFSQQALELQIQVVVLQERAAPFHQQVQALVALFQTRMHIKELQLRRRRRQCHQAEQVLDINQQASELQT
jgi:hypothetical protein